MKLIGEQEEINNNRTVECCANCQCENLKRATTKFIVGIYVIPLVVAAVVFAAIMLYLTTSALLFGNRNANNVGSGSGSGSRTDQSASNATNARLPRAEPKRLP